VLCIVNQVSWRECSLYDSEQLFSQLWGGPLALQEDAVVGAHTTHTHGHGHSQGLRPPRAVSGELQSFVIHEEDGGAHRANSSANLMSADTAGGQGYEGVAGKGDYVDL
jgi:hypothetical protein